MMPSYTSENQNMRGWQGQGVQQASRRSQDEAPGSVGPYLIYVQSIWQEFEMFVTYPHHKQQLLSEEKILPFRFLHILCKSLISSFLDESTSVLCLFINSINNLFFDTTINYTIFLYIMWLKNLFKEFKYNKLL